jgi:nucleoside-diphosphate-sugar epimerase
VKILLTGPTGFIGSAFARLALTRGHRLAGLLVPTENIPHGLPQGGQMTWLQGTLDEAPWEQLAGFAADVCVHAAWITTPGVYLESPDNFKFRDSSLRFLRHVTKLGTRHIVGLGTCIEYQIGPQPLSEATTPLGPTTTYARCKNELRLALEADAKAGASTLCWARVFYPYGPGEHPSRLCSSIIRKLSAGESVVLKTPDSTKDYIFIEDLAAALLAVVESRFTGAINLGTGLGISVRQIAQTLADMMRKPGQVAEAVPPENDPLPYVVADARRLCQLGWTPQHDLSAGLAKLLSTGR